MSILYYMQDIWDWSMKSVEMRALIDVDVHCCKYLNAEVNVGLLVKFMCSQ